MVTRVTVSAGDRSVEFGNTDEMAEAIRKLGVRPPTVAEFDNGDYIESPGLRAVGDRVIARWPELQWLQEYTIRYLWKCKGGTKGGGATLGKCTVASGTTRYFAGCDWIIWLAADHLRATTWTPEMTEALMYHELSHCTLSGAEDDPRPAARDHDLEVFLPEIQRYGLWRNGLAAAAETFSQAALPGMEP